MKKQKIIIFSVIIIALLSLLIISQGRTTKLNSKTNIPVYIADSPAERSKGLSGRESIPGNQGMLFVFDNDGRHSIWMKDMKFNIDVVWLDKQKNVVDIEKNISPDSYPKNYNPKTNARFILELSAGQVAARNITNGTQLSFTTVVD